MGPSSSSTSRTSRHRTAQQQQQQRHRRRPLIPLLDLVQTNVETSCPPGLILLNDTITPELLLFQQQQDHHHHQQHNPNTNPNTNTNSNTSNHPRRNIPRIIHVTAKTRCMPREFIDNLLRWQQFPDHAFVLHNEAAVDRLLYRYYYYKNKKNNNNKKDPNIVVTSWPAFPHLHHALQCIKGGAAKADLWRALILWEYGGIYTDMDNAPAKFHPSTTIQPDDDAFFVMEKSGILSQYFMAARPRHPLLYLLVQQMLSRLLSLHDVDYQIVSVVTGPGALRMAFCDFLKGQGPNGPVRFEPLAQCYYPQAKVYTSRHAYVPAGDDHDDDDHHHLKNTNRNDNITTSTSTTSTSTSTRTVPQRDWNVRVVGTANQPNEWVARDVIPDKNTIYQRMNMTYFRDLPKVVTQQSCFQRLYQQYLVAEQQHDDDDEEEEEEETEAADAEQ